MLPPPFDSKEQVLTWLEELCKNTEEARINCEAAASVVNQRKYERVFLTRHGAALGALSALLRASLASGQPALDVVAYNAFVERVRRTLEPTVHA